MKLVKTLEERDTKRYGIKVNYERATYDDVKRFDGDARIPRFMKLAKAKLDELIQKLSKDVNSLIRRYGVEIVFTPLLDEYRWYPHVPSIHYTIQVSTKPEIKTMYSKTIKHYFWIEKGKKIETFERESRLLRRWRDDVLYWFKNQVVPQLRRIRKKEKLEFEIYVKDVEKLIKRKLPMKATLRSVEKISDFLSDTLAYPHPEELKPNEEKKVKELIVLFVGKVMGALEEIKESYSEKADDLYYSESESAQERAEIYEENADYIEEALSSLEEITKELELDEIEHIIEEAIETLENIE